MASAVTWDPEKALTNIRKHGIAFEDATTVLSDPLSVTVLDPRYEHSDEPRFVTIGETDSRRLIVLVHADRGETVRIISARKPTRSERKRYEEGV